MIYKNIPDKYFKKVFFARFFLDYLAALQFLLKGYPANAVAVWKARKDFNRQKKTYRFVRRENLNRSVSELPSVINRKSLIVAFFLKGKKTYDKIRV